MAFCKYCGKQINEGKACPECAAANEPAVQPEIQPAVPVQPAVQSMPPQMLPQQPAPVGAVPMMPKPKRKVNKGIVALLSLLGVFTIFTAIVVAIFG